MSLGVHFARQNTRHASWEATLQQIANRKGGVSLNSHLELREVVFSRNCIDKPPGGGDQQLCLSFDWR